ncbi:MAG TPA: hypothetical protein VLH84_05865 [Patescibacteria group bacterium]|nr:hypothetical protein [Patescibacteria group bacterium]
MAIHLDRSPDDLIALALKTNDKPLYIQYQEWIRLLKGNRLEAIERVRDVLGLRLFRLAFFRAHCAPDTMDIAAARQHPDYMGGEMLAHRLVVYRPSRR